MAGAAGSGAAGQAASADSPSPELRDAMSFVQAVSEKTLAILEASRLPDPVREARLRETLDRAFGLRTICRSTVGAAWSAAEVAQRRDFCESFRVYLLGNLVEKLRDNDLSGLEVMAAERTGAKLTRVDSEIRGLGFTLAKISWLVRDGAQGPEIVDVITDGVSLVETYRSEFSGIVSRQGLPALTFALERKVARR